MRPILQPSAFKGKDLPKGPLVSHLDDHVRHRAKVARRIARRHDLRLNFASLVVEVAGLGGEVR